MLQTLFLRDFLVVDSAEIEFAAGFCVLTGETGAGKSILLDALGLVLGARGDVAVVRPGSERTDIAARFTIGETIHRWLADHDLDGDPSGLLLRRVIDRDGRSKAYINGAPVTIAQLRTLGEQLLEIHGQHASQSLLRADGQRDLLDSFGQLQPQVQALTELWRLWRDAERRAEQARLNERELTLEREQLNWQLEELAAVDLGDDEWDALSADQTRLANASSLIATTQAAHDALSEGEDNLRDRVDTLLSGLRQGARLDASLANAVEMLESARIQIDEAASDLAGYAERIDADPARLAQVEQRLSTVFQLSRKMRVEPGELVAHRQALAERLARLDQDTNLEALQAELAQREADWRKAANSLTAARTKAARQLAGDVAALLPSLGMPQARFDVSLAGAEPGPSGAERIEFLFSANAGFELRALSKVASGGELSRVSLAIAVAAAQANPVPTLIFDEADAGVGGSVADAIGQLMRQLGQSRQILAVTHLPQVAARGHGHYLVSREKSAQGSGTRVRRLDDEARIEEVARMLGGARVSATTRNHAGEMIRDAAADTPAPVGPGPQTRRRTKAGKRQPLAGMEFARLLCTSGHPDTA
ncbi:MAG: DNA repair protein RecN [Burkholderiaceae bacterium]